LARGPITSVLRFSCSPRKLMVKVVMLPNPSLQAPCNSVPSSHAVDLKCWADKAVRSLSALLNWIAQTSPAIAGPKTLVLIHGGAGVALLGSRRPSPHRLREVPPVWAAPWRIHGGHWCRRAAGGICLAARAPTSQSSRPPKKPPASVLAAGDDQPLSTWEGCTSPLSPAPRAQLAGGADAVARAAHPTRSAPCHAWEILDVSISVR
jgi:hypothetical protein